MPKSSTVTTLKDLAGKKVAVVNASTADDVASREFGKTSPNIRRFESTPLIISGWPVAVWMQPLATTA